VGVAAHDVAPEMWSTGGLRSPFLDQEPRCEASAMLLRSAKQPGGSTSSVPMTPTPTPTGWTLL
jgi:hypothetical protein